MLQRTINAGIFVGSAIDGLQQIVGAMFCKRVKYGIVSCTDGATTKGRTVASLLDQKVGCVQEPRYHGGHGYSVSSSSYSTDSLGYSRSRKTNLSSPRAISSDRM